MTPISLPDWIQRARVHLSGEDYLGCAIQVSYKLTCLLSSLHTSVDGRTSGDDDAGGGGAKSDCTNASSSCEEGNATGAESITSPPCLMGAEIADIVLENVVVYAPNKKIDHFHNGLLLPAAFRAMEVNLRSIKTTTTTTTTMNSHANFDKASAKQILLQRDLCFALGKILFEIFSAGSSQFLTEPGLKKQTNNSNNGGHREYGVLANIMGGIDLSDNNEHHQEGNDVEDDLEEFTLVLPALKKAFLSSTVQQPSTATKSMKANESLQGQKLPPMICQLITDLLDAEEGNPYISDTALLSLEKAGQDILQIRSYPERSYVCGNGDRSLSWSCPKRALEKTNLFGQISDSDDELLFGRKNETKILGDMAARVSQHALSSQGNNGYLCEAAFISGHSGSGKSSLTRGVISYWNKDDHDWTVIFCKFDRQAAPLSILIRSFDSYFGKFVQEQVGGIPVERAPSKQVTFDRISRFIDSCIDSESVNQLCQLLPIFSQIFCSGTRHLEQRNLEQRKKQSNKSGHDSLGTLVQTGQMTSGSGRNRLLNLLHLIFNAVCSGGKPMLICT